MGRGANWSKTDDERLMALINDNEGKRYTEIADLALKYEMFSGRTRGAVASRVSYLLAPKTQPEEQLSINETINEDASEVIALNAKAERLKMDLEFYKALYESQRQKYDALLDAVLFKCDGILSYADGVNFPKYNYRAITRCLKEFERESYEMVIQMSLAALKEETA